ncbi:MAG: DUF6883 domain-containing protein [Pirellulales bacterium]
MKLPNAENAFIDPRKITDYSLSSTHPVGKHKAVVFESVLGLTIRDAHALRMWLLQAAQSDGAVIGEKDEFGQRYQIDFDLSTPKGKAIVRSAWIIRSGEVFPRLVSCFIP